MKALEDAKQEINPTAVNSTDRRHKRGDVYDFKTSFSPRCRIYCIES